MKTLVWTLVGALGFVLFVHAGDEGLTAEELARHLHVSYWVTKVDLHGKVWNIEVVHVKDGQVQSGLLFNEAHPTDREFERIVVLADQTPLGTKISIQPGSSAKVSGSRTQATETVFLSNTVGIADKVTEGDYFLGGSSADFALQSGPIKIQEVKDGLVLRLHPKD